MSSTHFGMDDSRHMKAGGSESRYPWMGLPPPAEGRVTPPKPMKPWTPADGPHAPHVPHHTSHAPHHGPPHGSHHGAHHGSRDDSNDVIIIPRPFTYNHDLTTKKEDLINAFREDPRDRDDVKHVSDTISPTSLSISAFEKGYVRELEKCSSEMAACSSSGNLKPRINCEFCEQTFSRREGLKRHEITAHTDIRNYKCEECPQTFARKDKLKRHIETVHMTEKRFECETCGKGFNRKDKLQKHLHSDKAHLLNPPSLPAIKGATVNVATQCPEAGRASTVDHENFRREFESQRRAEEEKRKHESSVQSHEYSDSARAFLESLSQRLNTDLPVFP